MFLLLFGLYFSAFISTNFTEVWT